MDKPVLRPATRAIALLVSTAVFVGCSGSEHIALKDVGYTIPVEPTKKIEELPKNEQPRKGQSSARIKRDPSGVNRNQAN
jgi:hypothetical protein